jgi:hypothetical protein
VTPEPGTARPEATRIEEPGLLARLVLSGRLGRGGVTVSWWNDSHAPTPEDEVSVDERTLYLAETLAVVSMTLELSPAAAKPWGPGEAWLLDVRGSVVGRFPLWMEGTRLGPGEKRTVAFEVERVPGASPKELRLELRERDGGRTVQAGDLEL